MRLLKARLGQLDCAAACRRSVGVVGASGIFLKSVEIEAGGLRRCGGARIVVHDDAAASDALGRDIGAGQKAAGDIQPAKIDLIALQGRNEKPVGGSSGIKEFGDG